MRFPFPEKIPLQWAFVFASVLLCLQVGLRTDIYFASCVFIYILLATYAFNVCGGMFRASGAFVLLHAVFALILSQCMKVVMGEPANSNLHEPDRTITVYLVAMIGVTVAAIANQKIRPRKSIVDDVEDIHRLPQMAIGCFLMGALFPWIAMLYGGNASGSIWAALNQLQYFLPLSIILATYSAIKTSKGARSVNALSLIAMTYSFLGGLLASSKQGIFSPLAAYLLTCAALRFRFKIATIALLAVIGVISVQFLVPVIQIMKGEGDFLPTFSSRFNMEKDLLSHPVETAAAYKLSQDQVDENKAQIDYYDVPMGLMDRWSLISISSLLVEYTDHGHLHGWHSMVLSVESIIPHFIWPDKPSPILGNEYAREIGGIVGEDDTTTGITIPFEADSYALGGLMGVFLISSVVVGFYLYAFDALVGDIRKSPWGLVVLVLLAHDASEIGAGGLIPNALITTLKIWTVVMLTRHVLPAFGSLFRGPEKAHIVHVPAARPIPRRPGSGPRVAPQNLPATGD